MLHGETDNSNKNFPHFSSNSEAHLISGMSTMKLPFHDLYHMKMYVSKTSTNSWRRVTLQVPSYCKCVVDDSK